MSNRTHAEARRACRTETSIPLVIAPRQPVCEPDDDTRLGARSVSRCLLGARFRFVSDSHELLRLVTAAYDGLPQYHWPDAPEFLIQLHLLPRRRRTSGEPPPLQTQEMPGALCGVIDASNYVLAMPARERALVVASEDMLDHPQHLRQELIEFAVFILAARGQRLVPLHAACIGAKGRGVLLLGDSGAGKSTLALHAFLHGYELLSEDAVFVRPQNMLATGVANYARVRTDASLLGHDENIARWIRGSPVIRRNSGVRKFEADLRHGPGRLAATPLRLCAIVFVSKEPRPGSQRMLQPLHADDAVSILSAEQTYAATQPGWDCFLQQMKQLDSYRLTRGDPAAALAELARLLV
jgi:hypothetical protein